LDNDKSYYLNDIMAVGRLPQEKDNVIPDEDKVDDGNTGAEDKVDPTDPEVPEENNQGVTP